MRIARRCPKAAQYASALWGLSEGPAGGRLRDGRSCADGGKVTLAAHPPPLGVLRRTRGIVPHFPETPMLLEGPLRARLQTSPTPGKPFRTFPNPSARLPGGVERGPPLDALPITRPDRTERAAMDIAGEQGGAWFVVHASCDAHDDHPRRERGEIGRVGFTHIRTRLSCSTPPPSPPQ